MDDAIRQRLLMIGDWSPRDRVLWDLGIEYHTRCEIYDRTVCAARNERGVAIPSNPQESASITRNAHRVHEWAVRSGAELGYTAEQVRQTIKDTAGVHIP